MYPLTKPMVGAMLIAAGTASLAQTAARENEVVVTATRFAQADPNVPANISVITRQDIERSPARTIPDLLNSYAGIDIRPLYGALGIDAVVDVRGTGDTAASNVLVLLDGQRLNPVDAGSIKWETVPLSAVRRIEIVRGSGSVLYGDRASAGVINIITDKSDTPRAGARVEVGSYGYRALNAHAAGGKDGWYGSLFASGAHADGYRRNNDADQSAVSGRVARRFDSGELFIDLAGYYEAYGLPGGLTRAQYDQDPRQASSPHYRLNHNGYRLRPGGSFALGETLLLEIDGSIASDDLDSKNPDWLYRNRRHGTSQTFSPRLKWSHGLPGAVSSDTVLGIDAYEGKVNNKKLDFDTRITLNHQPASQTTAGAYAQNLTVWQNGFDSTLAVRRQHFSQKVVDESAGLKAQSSDDLTAWEAGGGYRLSEGLRVYAKIARNFRLPNTDELFAYQNYDVVFNGALQPQTGRLKEVGAIWQGGAWKQQLTVFRQDNQNEIGYIQANGRNANLDPLRRQGVESETTWRPDRNWTVRLALTYLDAKFTEGAFAGKAVPLVPRHKESLSLQWDGGRWGVHSAILQSVGARYFGSDFANAGDKLAAYTTLDYQAAWNFKPWTLGLRVTNVGNAKYAAVGYINPVDYSSAYYPADPRGVFVSAKLDY